MKEILVINDDSYEVFNVAAFAIKLAKIRYADILLANMVKQNQNSNKVLSPLVATGTPVLDGCPLAETTDNLKNRLTNLVLSSPGFRPTVTELDASRLNESELCDYINNRQINLVIKIGSDSGPVKLNIPKILNKIVCPVLLIPPAAKINIPERMVYLTDLRYCQQHIVRYLRTFNNDKASILLAHICENGLVDLNRTYAIELFAEVANLTGDTSGLFFAHIKPKDITKSIDVLIDTMKADLLVCVKRQLNDEYIWKTTTSLPELIPIPILVFPF